MLRSRNRHSPVGAMGVLRLARIEGNPGQFVGGEFEKVGHGRLNIHVRLVDMPAKCALAPRVEQVTRHMRARGELERLRRRISVAESPDIINRCGGHLPALIDDMLEMSKIEVGLSQLARGFDYSTLLRLLDEPRP